MTAFALALDAAAGDHAAWPLYAFAPPLGSAQAFAQLSFTRCWRRPSTRSCCRA